MYDWRALPYLGLAPCTWPITTTDAMSMGFIVTDIEEAKATLDKNGIAYQTSNDEAGEIIYFKDPDGHSVII